MPSYAVAALTTILMTAPAVAAPCALEIVRAPEDVRRAVETRTDRHLSCASLSVRVITQDDGLLYAIVIAPDGTVKEQAFADATEAAIQIVAWAVEATPRRSPPATAPASPREEGVVVVAAPPSRSERWIALSGLANPYSRGIRGELDVIARSGWIVGIAVGLSGASLSYGSEFMRSELAIQDLRGVVGVTRAMAFGRWQIRARVGVGVVSSDVKGLDDRDRPMTGTITTAIGEGSVQLSRVLGRSWAIGAGALFTYYGQDFRFPDGLSVHRELDTVAVATVQRRL
ncbi:MAG TPA: hypothetical protein VIU61_07820 [Kofleriaceae bacterium]